MKIYSEQYNGEKLTDLASSFVCVDLTVIQPASVLESPVALEGLVYNGKEQDLIIPGCAVNGSMKYKIGEDGTYSEDVPKAKNAGEYKVYFKVFGNDGFADIEEHAISVAISKAHVTVTPDNIVKMIGNEDPALTATVQGLAEGDAAEVIAYTISRVTGEDEGIYQINTDGKKDQGNYEVSFGTGAFTIEEGEIIYTISDNMNGSYNIGCKKDLVITVKRNINDHKTFDNYKESTIDGKTVTKEQGTTTKGSLVLTLKSSYLDTLSEGEHKIKVSFTDGEALATVNIGKVKGKSLPKTGDTSVDKTPLAWMLIITAAAGITMTVLIEKKRHK
jgi:predicted ABC-type ATPase